MKNVLFLVGTIVNEKSRTGIINLVIDRSTHAAKRQSLTLTCETGETLRF